MFSIYTLHYAAVAYFPMASCRVRASLFYSLYPRLSYHHKRTHQFVRSAWLAAVGSSKLVPGTRYEYGYETCIAACSSYYYMRRIGAADYSV